MCENCARKVFVERMQSIATLRKLGANEDKVYAILVTEDMAKKDPDTWTGFIGAKPITGQPAENAKVMCIDVAGADQWDIDTIRKTMIRAFEIPVDENLVDFFYQGLIIAEAQKEFHTKGHMLA